MAMLLIMWADHFSLQKKPVYPEYKILGASFQPGTQTKAGNNGLLQKGVDVSAKGQFVDAVRLFRQAAENAFKTAKLDTTAIAYYYVGNCYLKLGKLDSSLFYYKKSLNIFKGNENSVRSYNAIGLLYEKWHQADSAMNFFMLAEGKLYKTSDFNIAGYTYNNIANVFYEKGQLRHALKYYNKAISAYSISNNKIELAGTFDNIGNVYSDSGNFVKAIQLYDKALQINKELDNPQGRMETLINIGVAENDYAYASGKKEYYIKALKNYSDALEIADKLKAPDMSMHIYKNLYTTYQNTGNFKQAFMYQNYYNTIKDSLYNDKNSKLMAQMLVQYEAEKKQNQIKLLQQQQAMAKDKMRIRNFQLSGTLLGLGVAILVLALLIINYRQRSKAQHVMNERRIGDLLKDQELKSISAMLEGQELERKRIAEDLHDRLGSMLSTVKLHFAAFGNSLRTNELQVPQYASANTLLDEACEEVRRIAHNMVSGVLTQFGLVPALRELADSIESSSDIKVNVSAFDLDERLESRMEIEIYRIVQELVSNILKHANATEVNIQLTRQEGLLNIMVEDNGHGFDTGRMNETAGMGLKNMAYRAERIGGTFHIDSFPGKGATAVIEIPL